jgi:7-dehydrocholesterol reductase
MVVVKDGQSARSNERSTDEPSKKILTTSIASARKRSSKKPTTSSFSPSDDDDDVVVDKKKTKKTEKKTEKRTPKNAAVVVKKKTKTNNSNKSKENHWGSGGDHDKYGQLISQLGVCLLILTTPFLAVMIWDVFVNKNGSCALIVDIIRKKSFKGYLQEMLPWPTKGAFKHLISYASFEAILQIYLPGKVHLGPITATGNVPVYKANGVLSLLTTYVGFFLAWHFGLTSPKIVYDLFGEMLFAMSIFAIFFCLFLTFKGLYFPTDSDSGTTGSFLYDFYWGTELYPKFGKLNVKQFTNCRFGMMAWALLPVVFACYQYERDGFLADSVLACVILMCSYNFKFFYWETGYFNSMDIMHDRAGYYICWGCLVWVPSLYVSPALFIASVKPAVQLGTTKFLFIVISGLLCVWINYDSDRQRMEARRTKGKMLIWGKKPTMIKAKYQTIEGEEKTSLLLVSGWWSVSRHFHYLPEISAAFFWTMPAGFGKVVPYSYVIFLTILLFDRSVRDDRRCAAKYGKYWDQYRSKVPYKVIPGVF